MEVRGNGELIERREKIWVPKLKIPCNKKWQKLPVEGYFCHFLGQIQRSLYGFAYIYLPQSSLKIQGDKIVKPVGGSNAIGFPTS